MKRSTALVAVVSCIFTAWIVVLSVFASIGVRNPVFYDSLGRNDVTAQYMSEIPLWRYILEPFVGITYTVVQYPFDALIGIGIGYASVRVVAVLLEKVFLKRSEKAKVIAAFLRNTTNFFVKYIGIGLAVGLAIVLPGWAIAGFHFFMITYMGGVRILVGYGLVILAIKVVWNVVVFFHPRGVLRLSPPPAWAALPPRSGRYWARKVPATFARETRYLLAAVFLMVVLLFGLGGARLPNYTIRTALAPNEHLIDFHVHTWYSDGSMSPADRVEWYIQQGITGAAFTDHDNMRGATEAIRYVEQHDRPFTVILGQEYTDLVNDIHLNIYGTTEQYAPLDQQSDLYPDVQFLNASDCIKAAKAAGAYVIVNHYSGPPGSPYTYSDLHAWGVDGFEIVNGGRDFPGAIREYCLLNGLACIGGTDEHMNTDVNTFVKVTLDDPSNVSAIFETLKLNTHDVVRVEYLTNPSGMGGSMRGVYPIRPAVNYFLNLDMGQYASWFAWSTGIFVVFLVFTRAVSQMDGMVVKGKIVLDPSKKGQFYRQLKARLVDSRAR